MTNAKDNTSSTMKFSQDVNLTVKWSRRRRSIGLSITTGGELVVHAPRGASPESIALALDKHRTWIERHLSDKRAAWAALGEGRAFFLGTPYRLVVATTPGAPESVALIGGDLRVCPGGNGADPWPRLRTWYQQEADRLLRDRVHHHAARLELAVGRIEVRDWKRRWGECRPRDGILRFNWRLVMLPLEIMDYVAVHELLHLRVSGHNPRFWGQVAAVLPDYAARRQWLQHYGAPFLLWQPGMADR